MVISHRSVDISIYTDGVYDISLQVKVLSVNLRGHYLLLSYLQDYVTKAKLLYNIFQLDSQL